MRNRSGMLDCGFKRYETGGDVKCSKAGLERPELRDRSSRSHRREAFRPLAMALGREDALVTETLHARAL